MNLVHHRMIMPAQSDRYELNSSIINVNVTRRITVTKKFLILNKIIPEYLLQNETVLPSPFMINFFSNEKNEV
jgi:hypothetical protein